jgi:hypothetical protein
MKNLRSDVEVTFAAAATLHIAAAHPRLDGEQ